MRLLKYQNWKSINESDGGKEPPGVHSFINSTPWSASFISFVYKQADPSFPSSAMHTIYCTNLKKNPNWELLDPKTTPLKLGDIIVANRKNKHGVMNNQKFTNNVYSGYSHADIVVELSPNSAKSIGGNTGSGADKVDKNTVPLKNGIITSSRFFLVLRPKSDSVAKTAVEIANAENDIWEENDWKEHQVACHTRLQAYYNAGNTSMPGYDKVDPKSIALLDKPKVKVAPDVEPEMTTGQKIFKLIGVVGEFMVQNGIWFGSGIIFQPKNSNTPGGPSVADKFETSKKWIPLDKFCQLTDKLDKEHPTARSSADIELNRQKYCSTPLMAQKSESEWISDLGNKETTIKPDDEELLTRAQSDTESEESIVTTENCQMSIPEQFKKKSFLDNILDFGEETQETSDLENIIIVYPGSDEKSGFNTLEKFKGLFDGKLNDFARKYVVVYANNYDTDFEGIREDIQKEVSNVDEYTNFNLILFGHSAQNSDLIEDLNSTDNIKGIYFINPYPSSKMISSITNLKPEIEMGIYYQPSVWQTKEDKQMYLLNAISTHLKKSGKDEKEFISKVKSSNLEESIEKGLDFFKNKIDYVS